MLSVRIDTHVVNFVMMCNYNNLLSLFFFFCSSGEDLISSLLHVWTEMLNFS